MSNQQVEKDVIRKTVIVSRQVVVEITDPDVIQRVTGPGGDEWRAQMYSGIRTEEDVLKHLASNCLVNGMTNAKGLDGWADLPEDAVRMELTGGVEIEAIFDE